MHIYIYEYFIYIYIYIANIHKCACAFDHVSHITCFIFYVLFCHPLLTKVQHPSRCSHATPLYTLRACFFMLTVRSKGN